MKLRSSHLYRFFLEPFFLVGLGLKTRLFLWRDVRFLRQLFAQDARYLEIDRALCRGRSPYRVRQAYPYGETPFAVLEEICQRGWIGAKDQVLELGCGRGRGALFLARRVGCRVQGVDHVEAFISQARRCCGEERGVRFVCGDLLDVSLKGVSVVFLYGLGMEEERLQVLVEACEERGVRVVSVGCALEGMEVVEAFEAQMPWGRGEICLQQKNRRTPPTPAHLCP